MKKIKEKDSQQFEALVQKVRQLIGFLKNFPSKTESDVFYFRTETYPHPSFVKNANVTL